MMNLFEARELQGKTVLLTTQQLQSAWLKVKSAKGSGGVDGKSIAKVEEKLSGELYCLWNRMSSGSYQPKAVKAVSIPKRDGSERWLGIPTVIDRVAQQVIKDVLEPELEREFHPHSYGYRPNKNTHQAIKRCSEQCWKKGWVIDLDIKGFFDNLDHDLLLKALKRHTKESWVIMYVERWLKAPVLYPKTGALDKRTKGTPQGGVISPLLANLYLHYCFDKWMQIHHPSITFERYADDVVVHCNSRKEAELLLSKIDKRMNACKLTLHPEKTKVVYCKQNNRMANYKQITFDFLGFRFQPRRIKDRNGLYKLSYGPAISNKAKKHIVRTINDLRFHRWTSTDIEEIAMRLRSKLLGWITYFGKYRKWSMYVVFRSLNDRLVKWLMNRYKKYRGKVKEARLKMKQIAQQYPNLFVHWKYGFIPG